MTAAFVAGNTSPEPSAKRDVCCPVANCPHIKFNQDQGCPCGGLRDIVESAPCSDPQGVCRTIEHKTKTCFVSGFEFNCEESDFGPPCGAPTPTPTPTPELTPTPTPEPCPQPAPDTCCDQHFFAAAPGEPPPPCRWDCRPAARASKFARRVKSRVFNEGFLFRQRFTLTAPQSGRMTSTAPKPQAPVGLVLTDFAGSESHSLKEGDEPSSA